MARPSIRSVAGHLLAWMLMTAALGLAFFLSSSATTTVASHDAVLRPTLDGFVTVHTGPYLPDLRAEAPNVIGVDISLGKTEVSSTEELVQRYAFIASQPDAQVNRVQHVVLGLALDAVARGAALALLPLLVWTLIGHERRIELGRRLWDRKRLIPVVVAIFAGVGVLVWVPWQDHDPMLADTNDWQPLGTYLPQVDVPDDARDIEITGNLTTNASRRLLLSALDTYSRSKDFYEALRVSAGELDLREPDDGDTVAVIVSDRHDNIGMDPVARAVADRAGATVVLDAGDDTSTGEEWETFSLDSLDDAFSDYAGRFAVSGNHDHGGFVNDFLSKRGWQTSSDDVFEGPGGTTMLAVDDPRSSGLGNWRDEHGLSIGELSLRIADEACAQEEPVSLLLVHDSDLGTPALSRGCVDLVISGHLHVQVGPTRIGSGWTYTNGTTGGAAYAIAVGSKLRRPAEVTLLTIHDGRPVGLQPVMVQTTGTFEVGSYIDISQDVALRGP